MHAKSATQRPAASLLLLFICRGSWCHDTVGRVIFFPPNLKKSQSFFPFLVWRCMYRWNEKSYVVAKDFTALGVEKERINTGQSNNPANPFTPADATLDENCVGFGFN